MQSLLRFSVSRAFELLGLGLAGLAGSQSSSKLAAKVTWENKAEQADRELAVGVSGFVSRPAEPGQAGQAWSARQDKRQAIRLDGTREVGRGCGRGGVGQV